jgi:hypothetical protein
LNLFSEPLAGAVRESKGMIEAATGKEEGQMMDARIHEIRKGALAVLGAVVRVGCLTAQGGTRRRHGQGRGAALDGGCRVGHGR